MNGKVWKWTPRTQAAVLDALRRGHTRRSACGKAHIHFSTLYEGMKADPTFSDAVEKAESEAEAIAVEAAVGWPDEGTGKTMTKEDARYWLQRRRRTDWSESQVLKHKVADKDEFDWAAAIGMAQGGTEVPETGPDGDSNPSSDDPGSR